MALSNFYTVVLILACIVVVSVLFSETGLPLRIGSWGFSSNPKTISDEAQESNADLYRNVLPEKFQWTGEDYPCLKGAFNDILIVITYNSPFYDNIHIINRLYGSVFGRVVHCGIAGAEKLQPDIIADVAGGHRGYVCMARAIEKYPDFQGYLYTNDDMIVNWWRLLEFDKKKVWQGPEFVDFSQDAYGEIVRKEWMWWTLPIGLSACQKSYETLKGLAKNGSNFNAKGALKVYLKNGKGHPRCGKGWSDFFYVPKHLAKTAQRLIEIYEEHKLFLEMAVMNLLHSLDYKENIEVVKGIFLPDLSLNNPADGKEFWGVYSTKVAFFHPFKFGYKEFSAMNKALVENWILDITRSLTKC